MKIHAFRLLPGQDLKKGLEDFALKNKISAGVLITCVGSLDEVALRMANEKSTEIFKGNFEIVSLEGTLSVAGGHFHLCVSDHNGRVTGGHLKNGSLINTTAEIVIGEISEMEFLREDDVQTGYKELVIKRTE